MGKKVGNRNSLTKLFKFFALFVGLNSLTKVTIFFEHQFFRCIELISLSYVIYVFTNSTLKPKCKSCSFRFFCHIKTPFRSQVQIILYIAQIINNLEPAMRIELMT